MVRHFFLCVLSFNVHAVGVLQGARYPFGGVQTRGEG